MVVHHLVPTNTKKRKTESQKISSHRGFWVWKFTAYNFFYVNGLFQNHLGLKQTRNLTKWRTTEVNKTKWDMPVIQSSRSFPSDQHQHHGHWWIPQAKNTSDIKNPPAMRRHGFNPCVGKIPWRRAWQPTPVFLPGESPWTEKPGGLQSMGSRRVGHDWATKHSPQKHLTEPRATFFLQVSKSSWTVLTGDKFCKH